MQWFMKITLIFRIINVNYVCIFHNCYSPFVKKKTRDKVDGALSLHNI